MGFILLGLMTLNQIGISGAIIQMVSHGILAGLLFGVVGRMVYDRTHTRDLSTLGPMNLNKVIPFAAITFVVAGMAGMGLPGFSGFVAELMILIGAWRAFPILALCVGFGIIVGIVYVWRAMQKAFFAETTDTTPIPHGPCPPITLHERLGAIILICTSIAIGLYPQMLLKIITPALNSPLFAGLRGGKW
jgi:NADH-quinone oxidoreductase subunit M